MNACGVPVPGRGSTSRARIFMPDPSRLIDWIVTDQPPVARSPMCRQRRAWLAKSIGGAGVTIAAALAASKPMRIVASARCVGWAFVRRARLTVRTLPEAPLDSLLEPPLDAGGELA